MKNIHIDFDESNMMAKLASEQFYEAWHVFIRELLQNAFDACNTKQALDWSWGTEFLEIEQAESLKNIREPYKSEITVAYDSVNKVFSIEDNGIGINEEDLIKFVARVGESFYTSEDFQKQRLNYEPISRHGLGMLSCFMVARAILIESKKDHAINTAWNVDNPEALDAIMAKWFENGTEIEYVNTKRKKSGTKISMPLKSEYAQYMTMDFLVESITHYTMYQPIPIKVICDQEVRVISKPKPTWDMPYLNVLGIKAVEVDTEQLEGFIVISNSRYKINTRSKLYQQNILISESMDALELAPKWLSDFTFYLNIKKRLLNLSMSRSTVTRDDNMRYLRELLGNIIIKQFAHNPPLVGQYLADGTEYMMTGIKDEEDFLARAILIGVYIKRKEVEIPISTFLKGFADRKIRIAIMSKSMFHYYKSSYMHDFKHIDNEYDAVVFDDKVKLFMQFILPYVEVNRYVVKDTPGIIYTELYLNFISKKKLVFFNTPDYYPKGCDIPEVFCLVANDRTSPFDIVLNPYNKNARLLLAANEHKKVRQLQTVIVENIKQRIKMAQNKGWDKMIDYGGNVIDEWSMDTPLSIQSIWCLEKDFADKLNTLIASKLTPLELGKFGLNSLYFTDEDFITWWHPPGNK